MNWLAENAARIVVYGLMVLAFALLFELDGFRRGELKLYDYQAKEATQRVAVVTKVVTKESEAQNAVIADLRSDNDRLRVLYNAERGKHPLADAARRIEACENPQGKPSGMRDAASVLSDVEGAILEILATGDAEIAKFRRLYELDIKRAEIRK